eukprot:302629_1
MAQQDIQPTAFDEWLCQNEIRIPRSLREKLFHHHLDSVDVLTALKASNHVEGALQILNLDVIQEAIFTAITNKIRVAVSHNSPSNEGAQSKSITPQLLSLKDNNDGTVDIKVKLVEAEVDPALKGSLRLEWADDEKALDIGSKTGINLGSNDMELNTEHELKNIAVETLQLTNKLIQLKNKDKNKEDKTKATNGDNDKASKPGKPKQRKPKHKTWCKFERKGNCSRITCEFKHHEPYQRRRERLAVTAPVNNPRGNPRGNPPRYIPQQQLPMGNNGNVHPSRFGYQ